MIFDMEASLEQKPIVFHLSDPWGLGESLEWKSISAVVLSVDESDEPERLLLKLDEPFEYGSVRCEYFVALPRHEGSQFKELKKGQKIFSGLTRISEDRMRASDPFDLSWWRGGPALIGELVLSEFEE